VSGPSVASRWCTTPRPQPGARWRLLCLPHAGAGASAYFAWGAALQPAGIEVRAVQYPGRENRLADPLIASAPAMVAALADQWPALAGTEPWALFGHSMGALLGFELAAELARRGATNPPRHLFLSGRNPPPVPPRLPPLGPRSDADFLAGVAERYGSLPAALLADPEMRALLTPILRADFQLVDDYAGHATTQIDAPLTILGGTRDPFTSPGELADWRHHTRAACRVHLIEGGHFFHQQARGDVLRVIAAGLADDARLP
jgi:medium-chain acyl-[acyl-carrier-protein] hydrolase